MKDKHVYTFVKKFPKEGTLYQQDGFLVLKEMM